MNLRRLRLFLAEPIIIYWILILQEGLTGREAEAILESVNIIVNREVVLRDTRKPYIAPNSTRTSVVTNRDMDQTKWNK